MFFFFKQKTAYEMLRSLVGSEMCIRDRSGRGNTVRYHSHQVSRLVAVLGVSHKDALIADYLSLIHI